MKISIVACTFCIFLFGCLPDAGTDRSGDLRTDKEKLGYVIGLDIGERLKNQPHPIDFQLLLAGIEHAYLDRQTLLGKDSIRSLQAEFQKKSDDYERGIQSRRDSVLAFMEENKKRKEVISLPNGLQFMVVQGKSSPNRPGAKDMVRCHIKGYLQDGTLLEDSRKESEPRMFHLDAVLGGIQSAMQEMSPGMKVKAWIPPQLAYGRLRKGRAIPEYSLLVYEIELLEIIRGDSGEGNSRE